MPRGQRPADRTTHLRVTDGFSNPVTAVTIYAAPDKVLPRLKLLKAELEASADALEVCPG